MELMPQSNNNPGKQCKSNKVCCLWWNKGDSRCIKNMSFQKSSQGADIPNLVQFSGNKSYSTIVMKE